MDDRGKREKKPIIIEEKYEIIGSMYSKSQSFSIFKVKNLTDNKVYDSLYLQYS